jgi:hypothetical protein
MKVMFYWVAIVAGCMAGVHVALGNYYIAAITGGLSIVAALMGKGEDDDKE